MSREERKQGREERRKGKGVPGAPPPQGLGTYYLEVTVPCTVVIEVADEGVTPPSPSPAPSPGESAQGTTIPPALSIVDSEDSQWQLAQGKVYRNGEETVSEQVELVLYFDHEVYQNAKGGWWVWVDGWVDSGDPRVEAPAPGPSPTPPPPSSGDDVPLGLANNKMLQVGEPVGYWIQDDTWGTQGLTRGTYTGVDGKTFESYIGRGEEADPVRCRWAWKVPKGPNEVKLYETIIFGAKPGYHSDGNDPNGLQIVLPDGSISQEAPCGATPENFLPLRANGALAPIMAEAHFTHMSEPTGLGQVAYDIWLQSSPEQFWGFNNAPLTHEIMIQLDNWGSYGGHPHGSNPAWYQKDVTLEGVLWHYYQAENFGTSGWRFCVFKPDTPLMPVQKTLNLSAFMNWLKAQGITQGTEYVVDIELGIEAVEQTGDVQLDRYRVSK